MALDVETGYFTKDSSNVDATTQEITTGFTPKAIIMWSNVRTTTTDETSEDDSGVSYGFSDGTNDRAEYGGGDHGSGSADAHSSLRDDAVFVELGFNSNTVEARASIAFGTDKFTLTWDVASVTASIIHYIIYGGADLTDVDVDHVALTAGTGSQSVATSINTADIVFFAGIAQTTIPNEGSRIGISYGAAISSTKEFCSNWKMDNGDTIGIHSGSFNNDACIRIHATNGTTIIGEADFTNFTSSGFDLNKTDDFNGRIAIYLTMKGGQWEVGDDVAKITTTGTKTYTTAFQPEGVMIYGVDETALATTGNRDFYNCIGGACGIVHLFGV